MIYLPPQPTNVLKERVHAFAEQVAARLAFEAGDPIEPLVVRLGGKLQYKNATGSEPPDSIVVEPTKKFRIFLSSMTSAERDRFTIAHELGHFFLHFPIVSRSSPEAGMKATRWVDENDPVQRRAEWEANWFAGAFLMSSSAFLLFFEKFEGDLARLALKFGVSGKAAEVRAKNLGLI